MKQEQPIQIYVSRTFFSLLLALACAAAGCDRSKAGSSRSETVGSTGSGENEIINLGDDFKMEFVLIQPGSFMMGSQEGGPAEFGDEKPAHQVTLTKPFYLGKYEVTQEQWLKVMKSNPSQFEDPDLPVENVSWDDVQSFLTKLRKKTGRKFALPTEAQWEYACRAGTTTRYSCGNSDADLMDYAWFADNSGRTTHPVGERKPNPWGLYDMHGNVSEWCADDYSRPYADGEATDPLVKSSYELHVVRGGGCNNKANGTRSSNRNSEWRGVRFFGLRCAIVVDEAAR